MYACNSEDIEKSSGDNMTVNGKFCGSEVSALIWIILVADVINRAAARV